MTSEDIITLVIILCVYMCPLAIIAASHRTRGNEKTYWMLATVFLSWFALVAYLSITLSLKERRERYRNKLINQYKMQKKQQLHELHKEHHGNRTPASSHESPEQTEPPHDAPDAEKSP